MVSRGQAYTLEGVLAAILVVTATVYGLQTIDTRAWEGQTRSETQQLEYRAGDVLRLASETPPSQNTSALQNATLCYRPGDPIDGNQNGTVSQFERLLNTTFDTQADDYNVYFSYWNGTGRESRLVSQRPESDTTGPPDTAATATTTVTLTDTMSRRFGDSCTSEGPAIGSIRDFYMSDASSGPLYNVVEVRLVVW